MPHAERYTFTHYYYRSHRHEFATKGKRLTLVKICEKNVRYLAVLETASM